MSESRERKTGSSGKDQVMFQQIVSIDCASFNQSCASMNDALASFVEQAEGYGQVSDSNMDSTTGQLTGPAFTRRKAAAGSKGDVVTIQKTEVQRAKSGNKVDVEPGDLLPRYRIDQKHDRFHAERLRNEPNLHVSVKPEPIHDPVDIEELARHQKAIKMSQGQEMQQILVSAYESNGPGERLEDLNDLNKELVDARQLQIDLPSFGQVEELKLAEPIPEKPTKTAEVKPAMQVERSVEETKTELTEFAEIAKSVKGVSDTLQELRPMRLSQPTIKLEVLKPAWEVRNFRWPATIKMLCTNHKSALSRLLDSLQSKESIARIGVIHTAPGQGATTLSVCLANSLIESRSRVLLADLDFGKPNLDEVANIQLNKGWQSILSGKEPLNEYLVRESSTQLSLLPLMPEESLVENRTKLVDRVTELSPLISYNYDYTIYDIGSFQNLLIEENCHVGFLDGAVIVSDSDRRHSTAVDIYEKLMAAGVRSVVIAENFRNPSQSAA